MKKFIVITSIFEPTKAVKEFASLNDYTLIVVGDKKSPDVYDLEKVEFLSWNAQLQMDSKLADHLPFNHYCRKMIGYLSAMRQGADVIVDTDDDNIPKENWIFPSFEGRFRTIQKPGFVNIYELYTENNVWPRGFPIRLIKSKTVEQTTIDFMDARIGVWQGLADEDPDVDAIYRLTNGQPIYFNECGDTVLADGVVCPFNSQNTAFMKDLFSLLYLPSSVTFRFTDILRGIVSQPIMWAAGYQLGFTNATVVQHRNPHDYLRDFESEVPMYLNVENALNISKRTVKPYESMQNNLYNIYIELERKGIVEANEIKMLEFWIEDINNIR